MKRLPGGIRKENRPAAAMMAIFVCVWLLLFAMDQDGEAVETGGNVTDTEDREDLSGNTGGSEDSVAGNLAVGTEEPDGLAGKDTGENNGSVGEQGEAGDSGTDVAGNSERSSSGGTGESGVAWIDGVGSLFDSKLVLTEEQQAARSRILLAQLDNGFRIPMRLGDAFGRLPVWKDTCNPGILLYAWSPGESDGAGEEAEISDAGLSGDGAEQDADDTAENTEPESGGTVEGADLESGDAAEGAESESESGDVAEGAAPESGDAAEGAESESESGEAEEETAPESGEAEEGTAPESGEAGEEAGTESDGAEETEALDLESIVSEMTEGYDGVWSVYFKNLKTGESFVLNDQPMKSASVMKLFIMGTVYTAMEKGELERTDEIMSLMQKMISNSDNDSSNQLLYILGNSSYADGIARVDAFIEEYGFSDMTIEYNGFDNPDTVTVSGSYNQVSAKDCGKLLEDIYRRTWVSRSVSNEIEEMLLAQKTRYKIPAGLPDGVLCGNKSGEMDATENDAAIIYSDNCDYILVILSSDWGSKNTAISRIADISSAVYEYLNP